MGVPARSASEEQLNAQPSYEKYALLIGWKPMTRS